MATYTKRSGKVFCQIRRKGYRSSRTFPTKTAARAWAEPIEAKLDDGRLRWSDRHLHDAIDEYIEKRAGRKKGARWIVTRLQRMKCEFPNRPVGKLVSKTFADWRDERMDKVSPSTVRREMNVLSAMFNVFCLEWGYIDHNPIKGLWKPSDNPPREVLITPEHRQMLYEAAGYILGANCVTVRQSVCAACEIACNTAMRLGEIQSLEWSDIDLGVQVATLSDTKNGLPRKVPLNTTAVKVYDGLKDRPKPFPHSRDSLSRTFMALKKECGLDHIRFHDSRATAITNLVKRGLPINTVARISGHKDLTILQNYYRESVSDIARMLG